MKKLILTAMVALTMSTAAFAFTTKQQAVDNMNNSVNVFAQLETGEKYHGKLKTVCYRDSESPDTFQCAAYLVEHQIILHANCNSVDCQPMGYDEVEPGEVIQGMEVEDVEVEVK